MIALALGYYIYRRRAEFSKYFSKGGDVDEFSHFGEVIPETEGDAPWLTAALLERPGVFRLQYDYDDVDPLEQESARPGEFRLQNDYDDKDPFEQESASSAYNPGEIGPRTGFSKKKSDLVFIM